MHGVDHVADFVDVERAVAVGVGVGENPRRGDVVATHELVQRRKRGGYLIISTRDDREARGARLFDGADESVERYPTSRVAVDANPEHHREVSFLRGAHRRYDVHQQRVKFARVEVPVPVGVVRVENFAKSGAARPKKRVEFGEEVDAVPARDDEPRRDASTSRAVPALFHSGDARPLRGVREGVVHHVRRSIDEVGRAAEGLLVKDPGIRVGDVDGGGAPRTRRGGRTRGGRGRGRRG